MTKVFLPFIITILILILSFSPRREDITESNKIPNISKSLISKENLFIHKSPGSMVKTEDGGYLIELYNVPDTVLNDKNGKKLLVNINKFISMWKSKEDKGIKVSDPTAFVTLYNIDGHITFVCKITGKKYFPNTNTLMFKISPIGKSLLGKYLSKKIKSERYGFDLITILMDGTCIQESVMIGFKI